MDLDLLIEQVDSKETFLRFVKALSRAAAAAGVAPKYTPDGKLDLSPRGWESGSVAAFLDAMAAWAAATSMLTGKPMVGSQPTWRTFAEILRAGAFYE